MGACTACKWYTKFEGVCVNGNSEWCADWPPEPNKRGCIEWEPNPDSEQEK